MRYCLGLAASVFLAYGLPAHPNERTTTAEAFVRALYKDYGNVDRPDYLGELAPRFFAPRLLKLIRSDERVLVGEIGKLDDDPLCDCQDDGGFRLSSIMIDRLSADRVTATAYFTIGAVPKVITLDLVACGNGWRIADVHSQGTSSLVSFLSYNGAPR